MQCYDCSDRPGTAAPAVGVCIRCGAGVCRAHAHESHAPAYAIVGAGRATHERPARHLTCGACRTAETS
ncbi:MULTISPECIES: DUF2180 family protein [Streptomyces]|uniref:DUF2180 family protein n=1 Tax=Streptomyces doudnae TaxID=3075536 RepID=A0ABD5EUH0_9ACTN|nr:MULTISPECIES: DUF2180 family protein [unclassified Streptomyces]MDT0438295.1 DUF2180 family protein [Streptomyces sp. DSM 41981]MYQ65163.1 DUF2180 family protein [Streptomyces sp. SID4950]SCD94081.1 Uncharacterized protein GA0115242_117717 [Streptomyces sp. SolWspMP-5a-2]